MLPARCDHNAVIGRQLYAWGRASQRTSVIIARVVVRTADLMQRQLQHTVTVAHELQACQSTALTLSLLSAHSLLALCSLFALALLSLCSLLSALSLLALCSHSALTPALYSL